MTAPWVCQAWTGAGKEGPWLRTMQICPLDHCQNAGTWPEQSGERQGHGCPLPRPSVAGALPALTHPENPGPGQLESPRSPLRRDCKPGPQRLQEAKCSTVPGWLRHPRPHPFLSSRQRVLSLGQLPSKDLRTPKKAGRMLAGSSLARLPRARDPAQPCTHSWQPGGASLGSQGGGADAQGRGAPCPVTCYSELPVQPGTPGLTGGHHRRQAALPGPRAPPPTVPLITLSLSYAA